MSKRPCRTHTATFKAKVALTALRDEGALAALSHGQTPGLICQSR
jgi:hypothetical protein